MITFTRRQFAAHISALFAAPLALVCGRSMGKSVNVAMVPIALKKLPMAFHVDPAIAGEMCESIDRQFVTLKIPFTDLTIWKPLKSGERIWWKSLERHVRKVNAKPVTLNGLTYDAGTLLFEKVWEDRWFKGGADRVAVFCVRHRPIPWNQFLSPNGEWGTIELFKALDFGRLGLGGAHATRYESGHEVLIVPRSAYRFPSAGAMTPNEVRKDLA